MDVSRNALMAVLLALLLLIVPACKKNPTTTSIEAAQPTIYILYKPASGTVDTTVTVTIVIAGNSKDMRVFGLDMSFNRKMLQFQEVRSGTLTGSWAAVDGNEVSPGSLKVGGFVGAGTPIPVAGQGVLAEIKFKVTGDEYGNGQQSQVCAQRYTDDLAGFTPDSVCATFTLQK
ncbi:MAG: cohesin domain-containing protein [Candidatus Aminicenantales bacterium]